jgi:hypothetical protein
MRINLPPETRQAEGIALETADQDSDGDHQQQPVDPIRDPQTTGLELEDTRFLVPEQLLTAEALRRSRRPCLVGDGAADSVGRFIQPTGEASTVENLGGLRQPKRLGN